MGAIMLGGSLDFPYHSLCPQSDRVFGPNVYPTLRSPSLLDCLVHIVSQVIQGMSAYDIVFHNPLPDRHSTPSLKNRDQGLKTAWWLTWNTEDMDKPKES